MAETEECHDSLPVKVEIEEDSFGDASSAIWNNWQPNEAYNVSPSLRFREHSNMYKERSISPITINKNENLKEQVNDISIVDKASKEAGKENSVVSDKLYTCSYCMKSFAQKNHLMDHLKLHLDNVVYQCNVCQLIFPDSSAMATHRTTHSQGKKPCQICGKITRHASLENSSSGPSYKCSACHNRLVIKRFAEMNGQHQYYSESRERRLTCLLCDKKFSVISDLTKHLRVHTGERPFLCQLCQKGFKQSSALTSHLRTHTGHRPYVCQLCFKAFTQSSALNTHRKIHTASCLYKLNNLPAPKP